MSKEKTYHYIPGIGSILEDPPYESEENQNKRKEMIRRRMLRNERIRKIKETEDIIGYACMRCKRLYPIDGMYCIDDERLSHLCNECSFHTCSKCGHKERPNGIN